MSSTVKYHCDICKKEIANNKLQKNEITIWVSMEEFLLIDHREVCLECRNILKINIQNKYNELFNHYNNEVVK